MPFKRKVVFGENENDEEQPMKMCSFLNKSLPGQVKNLEGVA